MATQLAAVAGHPVELAIPLHGHDPAIQTVFGLAEILAFVAAVLTGSVVAVAALVVALAGFLVTLYRLRSTRLYVWVAALAFGAVLWTRGFGPQDRELFRMKKEDIEELEMPAPGTTGDVAR